MRTETLALGGMTPIFTPEAAHSFLRSYLSEDAMAANIRSALNNEAGSSGSHASRSSDGSSSAPSQSARATSLSAPTRPRCGGSGAGGCGSGGGSLVGARRERCQWLLCCSVDGEGRTQVQQARRAGASRKGCSVRRRSATRRSMTGRGNTTRRENGFGFRKGCQQSAAV